MRGMALVLCSNRNLGLGTISRWALAPVYAGKTVANAIRLILKSNWNKALATGSDRETPVASAVSLTNLFRGGEHCKCIGKYPAGAL